MPNYDYECKTCGHTFETFQNMSDPPLRRCPKCGKAVRRLIGGGLGVIFKGSGFYVNDSRKTSSAAPGVATPAAKSTETKESKETKETKSPSEAASSKDKVAV
jgi:putative FmdB family regulatory protein